MASAHMTTAAGFLRRTARGWVIGLLIVAAQSPVASEESRYFNVRNLGGVWWFIDPEGKCFLSHGVNVVAPGLDEAQYDPTRPEYAWRRHYPDLDAWATTTSARLREWNFNTIGGWAHQAIRTSALPETEVLHLGAEEGVPWNDLFSDRFARRMDELARARVTPRRNDTRLVGWFTDNELAWYPDTIFVFHSGQPPHSATRRRLMRLLREHYGGDFAALRSDFSIDPGIDSFEDLQRGGALRLVAGSQGHEVVAKFSGLLAERYYQVVCQAIRRHDSNHLILGDRYHGHCPDAVVRAAGRHVDVVSTNYDWPRGVDGYLPRFYLRRLHQLSSKPVLVTEYYSAAAENRSGNPNSGGLFVVVENQPDRAEVVRQRLGMFYDEPFVVGAHWFAFSDEPPHGRPRDGEDYNFGLVDIHDVPYEELTATIRRLHGEAMPRHAVSAGSNVDEGARTRRLEVPQLPRATTLKQIDALLLSQATIPATEESGLADLIASWDSHGVYLTLAGNHCVMEDAYARRPAPIGDGLLWRVVVKGVEPVEASAEFELGMLGKTTALTRGSGEYFHWQRGVRYGATLAVDAKALGRPSWAERDVLQLRAELRDQRDGRRTAWSRDLILSLADDKRSEPASLPKHEHGKTSQWSLDQEEHR